MMKPLRVVLLILVLCLTVFIQFAVFARTLRRTANDEWFLFQLYIPLADMLFISGYYWLVRHRPLWAVLTYLIIGAVILFLVMQAVGLATNAQPNQWNPSGK